MSEMVTTVEELDALPEGSVVMDFTGDPLVKRDGEWRMMLKGYGRTFVHRCPVTQTVPAPAVDPHASSGEDVGTADPAGTGATPLAAFAGLAVALEAADRVRRRASDANAPLEVLAGVDGVIEEIVEAVRTLREAL